MDGHCAIATENAPKIRRTRKASKESSKHKRVRILCVASEGLPFSKTGGLADVVEALPKALVAQGHEVAVGLPRYRGTKAGSVVLPSLTIPLGLRLRFPAVLDDTVLSGVRYLFIDDPPYFDRDGIYG